MQLTYLLCWLALACFVFSPDLFLRFKHDKLVNLGWWEHGHLTYAWNRQRKWRLIPTRSRVRQNSCFGSCSIPLCWGITAISSSFPSRPRNVLCQGCFVPQITHLEKTTISAQKQLADEPADYCCLKTTTDFSVIDTGFAMPFPYRSRCSVSLFKRSFINYAINTVLTER